MCFISPEQAAVWCGGVWFPRAPAEGFECVCTDSRQARAGALFFALKGARVDGHDFLGAVAAAGGASVVRADFPVGRLPEGGRFLRVAEPVAALGGLAAGYRGGLRARVVGVTGSVGKTTTKELIANALARAGKTARTAGNFNNEIGLPLSVLQIAPDCDFAVIEAGMSHPGEMAVLRDILRPDVAVVTEIGPAHIEFFDSVRAIAEEKAALLERLPADGWAVLDDDDVWAGVLRERCAAEVVSCSLRRREVDYAGDAAEAGWLWVCERATGESARVPLPPPAGFMAANALKAVAVARRFGVGWDAIAEALAGSGPVGMRWAVRVVRAAAGEGEGGGWTAVNDGYNANPMSMRAALRAFAEMAVEGRKFLAVGPMLELGAREAEEHRRLGEEMARGDWAGVVVVSPETPMDTSGAVAALGEGLAAGGGAAETCTVASSHAQAAAWLRARLRPGDALLLKASRSIQIEKVLTELEAASPRATPEPPGVR